MTNFCNDSQPILSYYPPPDGDEVEKSEEHYSDYDFQFLSSRDFRTRIFFSDYAINGNNAWVRTHHTDCGIRPDIDYVREYYEASFDAQNHSAAKAALTGIMDSIFCMDTRQYYNFATVLASCLSHDAANVAFEGSVVSDNYKFSSNDHASRISKSMNQRRRFLLLLDIIFEEILSKRFLDDNCNIFRLVHAEIKGNRNKTSMIYCIFSFLLQSTLGIFVIAQVLTQEPKPVKAELKYGLYVLATLGSLFGLSSALPDVSNWKTIYKVYGSEIGLILIFDIFCNIVIPLFLVGVGWYVVTLQADYINGKFVFDSVKGIFFILSNVHSTLGVIMTTALLFIPEIDDQLPRLLGFDQTAIIENYLIGEAKIHYKKYMKMTDEDVEKIFGSVEDKIDVETGEYVPSEGSKEAFGVDFSDYFLTNSVMEGSDSHDFSQPFKIHYQEDGSHELDPSNFITDHCLVKQVDFRYIDSRVTHPSIGYLRLHKMTGEVVEIDFSKQGVNVERGNVNTLRGAFIITNFVMTANEIESLRLVGSENNMSFLRGLEYYSLWKISPDARKLLLKTKKSKFE